MAAKCDQKLQAGLLEIIFSVIQIKSSAKVVVLAICFPGVLLKDQHIWFWVFAKLKGVDLSS